MIIYDIKEVSRFVGFHRKYQPIPSLEEVNDSYRKALKGNKNAAIRLLDWRRHCFFVKSKNEEQVMSIIFKYCDELFPTKTNN